MPSLFTQVLGLLKNGTGYKAAHPVDPTHDPTVQANEKELGWEGAAGAGGIISDDFNPDLQGIKAFETADRMIRGDSQVRATMRVVTLPIRSTPWFVEEPKDATPAEKEATELLQANLFGGMEQSWDEVIRHCSMAIYYGWRVPEIIWGEEEGRIVVRRLAPRSLRLVDRWIYDQEGSLAGYYYQGARPVGTGVTEWPNSFSRLDRISIPIDKVVHLAYEPEDGSPQGMGLWRSMYRPWFFKEATLRIMGIGIERNLLGVPVAIAGDGAQADDKNAMKTMLRRLRAAHDGAFILPKGWSLDWFESMRTPLDAMPFLHYHDSQIALSGLAQMLNLGLQQHGTQAVGSVHSEHFQNAVESDAHWIERSLQVQLVDRWTLINYGPGVRPPQLRHKRIEAKDIGSWTSALQQLVSGGFVHPLPDDEEMIRAEMELPEIDRALLDKRQAERDEAAKAMTMQPAAAGPPKPGGKPGDDPKKACEEHGHEFAEDPEILARRNARLATEGSFTLQATKVLVPMLDEYLAELRPIVEAVGKKPSGLERLAEVEMDAAKYQRFVRTFLWDVFAEGQAALADDTGGQAVRRVSPKLRAWVNARAAVIAADHVSQVRLVALSRVLSGVRAEMSPDQIFSATGADVIERMNRAMESDWTAAAQEVLSRLGAEHGG